MVKTTLLDGVDVSTPKWRVSMGCLIDRDHEGMNPTLMSVHLRNRIENVNIVNYRY